MAFLKGRHLPFLLAVVLVLAYNVLAQSTEKHHVGALGTAEIEEQIQVAIPILPSP